MTTTQVINLAAAVLISGPAASALTQLVKKAAPRGVYRLLVAVAVSVLIAPPRRGSPAHCPIPPATSRRQPSWPPAPRYSPAPPRSTASTSGESVATSGAERRGVVARSPDYADERGADWALTVVSAFVSQTLDGSCQPERGAQTMRRLRRIHRARPPRLRLLHELSAQAALVQCAASFEADPRSPAGPHGGGRRPADGTPWPMAGPRRAARSGCADHRGGSAPPEEPRLPHQGRQGARRLPLRRLAGPATPGPILLPRPSARLRAQP